MIATLGPLIMVIKLFALDIGIGRCYKKSYIFHNKTYLSSWQWFERHVSDVMKIMLQQKRIVDYKETHNRSQTECCAMWLRYERYCLFSYWRYKVRVSKICVCQLTLLYKRSSNICIYNFYIIKCNLKYQKPQNKS